MLDRILKAPSEDAVAEAPALLAGDWVSDDPLAQLPAVPMAVERGLPVIFVVMNNRAHGTIADLQAANFGRSYGCEFVDPEGNFYSPDFAASGRACGADGYAIENRPNWPRRRVPRSRTVDRRSWTYRWSTNRCRHPGTGTSRTSTRASLTDQTCPAPTRECRPGPRWLMFVYGPHGQVPTKQPHLPTRKLR